MTFAEGLLRLTEDFLPEQAIQTHGEPRLLRMLVDSAVDTATSFGFLVLTYRIAFAQNQTTATIPDLVTSSFTYQPRFIQRIERASFEGWNLMEGARVSGALDEKHFEYLPGPPRFWYWKNEAWNSITILPKAHKAGVLVLDVVQMFPRTAGRDDQMWGGMHEAYQDIIILEAAKRAFDAAYESDDAVAQTVQARLSKRRQEFSLHLQRSSLAEIPVGQGGQG